MEYSLKCPQGTCKSEGHKYLGSDVFWIAVQGEVLYIRSENAFLQVGARFALAWR